MRLSMYVHVYVREVIIFIIISLKIVGHYSYSCSSCFLSKTETQQQQQNKMNIENFAKLQF